MDPKRELLVLRADLLQNEPDGDTFDAEFLSFLRWLVSDTFMSGHLQSLLVAPDTVSDVFAGYGTETRSTFIEVLERWQRDTPAWFSAYLERTNDEGRSPLEARRLLQVMKSRPDMIAPMVSAVDGIVAAYEDAEDEMPPEDARDEDIAALRQACQTWRSARREHKHSRVTSAALNIAELFKYARHLLRATGDVPKWLSAVSMSPGEAAIAVGSRDLTAADERRREVRPILARVIHELHASLLTTLDRTIAVARFAQRATMYDAARLRSEPETELTLELAKYLHDLGILALPVSLGERRPDLLVPGALGFVVESKLLTNDGKSKTKALRGFWQLHSYLVTCESGVIDAREGVLALFRIGGPNIDAPPYVQTPRFRLHCKSIDLGAPAVTGSRQSSAVVTITEQEIIAAVEKPRAPTSQRASGGGATTKLRPRSHAT